MKPLKSFVPFNKKLHDRKSFDCGISSLNRFLSENANRGMDARVNFTWVLPQSRELSKKREKADLKNTCAYYTSKRYATLNVKRYSMP